MTPAAAPAAPVRGAGPRRVTWPVTADYALSHLGFFGLMPVLPVLLRDDLEVGAGGAVGASLLAFTLTYRASSLFLSGWFAGRPIKPLMTTALLVAAAGLAALPFVGAPLLVGATLVVIGVGMSVNGLLSRALIGARVAEPGQRLRAFALVNVAVNVSAAVGPAIAAFVYARTGARAMLILVAGCYVVAALVVATLLERGTRVPGAARRALELRPLLRLYRDPSFRHLSLSAALGWFLYAQLFSALPLYLFATLDRAQLVATFFTFDAILVILLQLPLSRAGARRLESGTLPVALLLSGAGLFCVAFAIVGASGGALWALYAGVVVFAFGEMLFTPMVDTAFSAAAGPGRVVLSFNGRQVATAVGESLGAFAGGALWVAFDAAAGPGAYWFALAAAGIVPTLWLLATARAPAAARARVSG